MPAGSHRFEIGTIGCTVLSDGYAAYPTPWFFPDADPAPLNRPLESLRAPQDTVLCPYTCLLVETGRHVMLVDTGLGEQSRTSGAILARLEMAGIRPKDVDTVVLTHAHPDHIGGAVDIRQPKAPRPMFPNARYVISELEWEFWMGAQVLAQENLVYLAAIPSVAAQVVDLGSANFEQTVELDRGLANGLSVGQP